MTLYAVVGTRPPEEQLGGTDFDPEDDQAMPDDPKGTADTTIQNVLGLAVQPTVAPLCFAWYGRSGTPFTRSEGAQRSARKLAAELEQASGRAGDWGLFLGRIGQPRRLPPRGRSIRRNISDLLLRTPGSA